MTEEEKAKRYAQWLETRPANVRAVAAKFKPWRPYKCCDRYATILSFDEPLGKEEGKVTLTVLIRAEDNPGHFMLCNREVFGVDPADVVEILQS